MKEKKKDANENKDINEKIDKIPQEKEAENILNDKNKFEGAKAGWKYYQYKGPSTGITLKYQSEDYEIILLSDKRVFLPEEHPYTQKMLFNDFLIEL